jgi:hypothetical protein
VRALDRGEEFFLGVGRRVVETGKSTAGRLLNLVISGLFRRLPFSFFTCSSAATNEQPRLRFRVRVCGAARAMAAGRTAENDGCAVLQVLSMRSTSGCRWLVNDGVFFLGVDFDSAGDRADLASRVASVSEIAILKFLSRSALA